MCIRTFIEEEKTVLTSTYIQRKKNGLYIFALVNKKSHIYICWMSRAWTGGTSQRIGGPTRENIEKQLFCIIGRIFRKKEIGPRRKNSGKNGGLMSFRRLSFWKMTLVRTFFQPPATDQCHFSKCTIFLSPYTAFYQFCRFTWKRLYRM